MTTTVISARGGGAPRRAHPAKTPNTHPWPALWAMVVGFFMILVDSTIVAVANPSIMAELAIGYDTVIWVTSAYLLAYAVPLLLAGRLGDRFGPKNLYLIGLAVFTAASLWCGLSGSVEMLIAARVVQGIGAALLTPQTLSTITRIFPSERRGVAMSIWGATAGIATLVGPLVGGVLVDALGWEWIFFVNVPIGVIGLGLAVWLIPVLPTHNHRFDVLGVGLSGLGVFLIVFALQEGPSNDWAPWIWAMTVAGVGLMGAFVYWQAINKHEPLIPLHIFSDRDFSLSNLGITVIGFAVTGMVLPLMFYAQAVCGLSPTRSALLMAPMAIASGLLAPIVGKIVDRSHPRPVIGFGFSTVAISITWLSIEMTPTTPIWRLVLPFTAMGVGMAFIWSPLAATATRNLPAQLAGAGSGVFNATRQFGAVLGSAAMAAFMTSRIIAELPPMPGGVHQRGAQGGMGTEGAVLQLPEFLREPFSAAMSQSTLLPAFVALFGVVAALFMVGFATSAMGRQQTQARAGVGDDVFEGLSVADGGSGPLTERIPVISEDFDPFDDDDEDYVEYMVPLKFEAEPEHRFERDCRPEPDFRTDYEGEPAESYDGDGDTEPLPTHVEHPRVAPAGPWHTDPIESWRSLLDHPEPAADVEPIGVAHNGFHVDDEQRFRPITEFSPPLVRPPVTNRAPRLFDDTDPVGRTDDYGSHDRFSYRSPTLHQRTDGEPPRNRHYRADPDDATDYGRHSFRERD